MKKIVFIFLLFFCNYSYAQINLVRNPSFEEHSGCPNSLDDISLANFWNGIDSAIYMTYCLPEYFNICGIGPSTLPNNPAFYHYPRTGYGMVGMMMYYYYGSGIHAIDYSQGHLFTHLIAGQSYCVTFYVVLARRSGYKINHIGAYLDDGTIDTTTRCNYYQTEYSPQIVDTPVIYDTTNWTKIQGSFIANGTEKFITIGNFFDTGGTTHIPYIYPGYAAAYYLLDDVSVIATDAVANAGVDRATTTDATDSVQIGDTTGYLPCYWYANGVLIDSNTAGFKAHPSITTHYVMELNVCGHVTYDTATVYVWTTGLNNSEILEAINIYPNPAKDNFTIEGALGCKVRIYNIVGQSFDKLRMTSNKETIDISGLSKGVYIVEVCDTETGMRVSRRVVKE